MKGVIQFFKKHPIIKTLFLILMAGILLILITLWGLNVYTQHGKAVIVPQVTDMPERDAIRLLESQGFRCEVYDSIFIEKGIPGHIAEQIPAENSKVKRGRKIFLKIIAYTPRKIVCPRVEGLPSRQAKAILESSGFNLITLKEVDAEFDDLVMGVEYNNRPLHAGDSILYNQAITLLVGKATDSSLEEESLPDEEETESLETTTYDDWFN